MNLDGKLKQVFDAAVKAKEKKLKQVHQIENVEKQDTRKRRRWPWYLAAATIILTVGYTQLRPAIFKKPETIDIKNYHEAREETQKQYDILASRIINSNGSIYIKRIREIIESTSIPIPDSIIRRTYNELANHVKYDNGEEMIDRMFTLYDYFKVSIPDSTLEKMTIELTKKANSGDSENIFKRLKALKKLR